MVISSQWMLLLVLRHCEIRFSASSLLLSNENNSCLLLLSIIMRVVLNTRVSTCSVLRFCVKGFFSRLCTGLYSQNEKVEK